MSSISFRASARTIDHLGKGQIADTPTAVSELWKNAYDAYARTVALHTFDGDIKCGAIIDNGCGMTMEQIQNSWLVIGTNAKLKKQILPDEDRFNLPVRMTQGEKGIGRLSAAFLAPITLLVTKKINTDYSAVLINWRLFENPYLSLNEVAVPFASFDSREDIAEICQKLINELKENFCLEVDGAKQTEQQKWIRSAWIKFSQDEIESNADESNFKTTENKILSFCESFTFNKKITQSWFNILDELPASDGGEHGSALFLLDLSTDLSLLTNRGDKAIDNFHIISIENSLTETLKAFTDPFKDEELKNGFNYNITVFGKELEERAVLQSFDTYNYESFHVLEHRVEGCFDAKGWFRGNVVAFGKDLGEVVYPPQDIFDNNVSEVGGFSIKLGTFEIEKAKSTYNDVLHEKMKSQIKKDNGLFIFRDGLRVLPYGRLDNDFFEIEERRTLSAGRYYWSSRRMIGHIGLDQTHNKNLRDKAGREGFIKNQAARELKKLVVDLFIKLADDFFGGKSDARIEMLAILTKEKEARKKEQTKAKKLTQKTFRESLKSLKPKLDTEMLLARQLHADLRSDIKPSIIKLDELIKLMTGLEQARGDLKIPTKPAKVAGKTEEQYRSYRDLYSEYSELLKVSQEKLNQLEVQLSIRSPMEIGRRSFDSKLSMLNAQVSKYEKQLLQQFESLGLNWKTEASVDRKRFYEEAIATLELVGNKEQLTTQLNIIDTIYLNLADTFTVKYEAALKSLEYLNQGINLNDAFSMAEEEKEYFEKKAKNLSALAQLGISVEVMAHELEQQDMLVTRGLNSLPSDVKSHPGFTTALNAHKQLTDQIRFLSPLKLSGYQARQEITGLMIESHIHKFFRDRFERQRIEFTISERFRAIKITDLPSRIYPVFINILNNALYWVCLSENRKITIDIVKSNVVIANSGPKIDAEDVERLFELFYSRRTNGNGVGLYLCKENLAVAHHDIWYAQYEEEMLLKEGANFVIKFNGMEFVK